MTLPLAQRRSRIATVIFQLLNPLPYALFIAALVFDAIYSKTAEILWMKASAWLICMGLLAAVIPRLIDLVQVWVVGVQPRPRAPTLAFWLNALAIVAATANALVHSRDAYGSMPDGLWLSIVTVLLMIVANVALTLHATHRTS